MKPFVKVRTAMMIEDKKQEELAAAIGVNPTTFSLKMMGRTAWTLWEIYKMCELLHIPDTEISEYFPRSEAVPYQAVADKLSGRPNRRKKEAKREKASDTATST